MLTSGKTADRTPIANVASSSLIGLDSLWPQRLLVPDAALGRVVVRVLLHEGVERGAGERVAVLALTPRRVLLEGRGVVLRLVDRPVGEGQVLVVRDRLAVLRVRV